jgi:hypothetical protein
MDLRNSLNNPNLFAVVELAVDLPEENHASDLQITTRP